MTIKGKKVISPVKKAEAFASHYAKVSRLKFSRSERSLARKLKWLLRAKPADTTIPLFTLEELKSASPKCVAKVPPDLTTSHPPF